MSLKHYKNQTKKSKVLPSIYIGDRDTQEKAIRTDYARRYAFLNAGKKPGNLVDIPYNLDKAIAALHHRVNKHMGSTNKYAR